jgi:protein-disulfide isomerase-like protein with CxxC motif
MIGDERSMKARLIAMVSRHEMDFIDRISKDALYTTGKKLTRTDVVSAILEAVASLPINGKNVHSEQELRSCIVRTIRCKAER